VPVVPLVGPVGTVGVEIVSVVKLAVTVLLPSIVIVTGLEDPLVPPLQLLKPYPAFAVAVKLTCSP
jgi:hypothetical protein